MREVIVIGVVLSVITYFLCRFVIKALRRAEDKTAVITEEELKLKRASKAHLVYTSPGFGKPHHS